MACRDWEDVLAVGINIFRMLVGREQAWRDQVFRGSAPFSEDENLDHRARFENWLTTTREVVAEVLPELERRFGAIGGAAELRQYAALAEAILANWQRPHLSRAVGLREMTLSAAAAAELDRILAEAKKAPPPPPAGPRPKEVSAREFFAGLK